MSDRLPRHQTSNTLLKIDGHHPSLSVEDDKHDEDSGLVSKHTSLFLLVNFGGMCIKTLRLVLFRSPVCRRFMARL